MAIAMRTAGVTRGYKAKERQVAQEAKSEPTLLVRVLMTLQANAREIREFVVDEIVYATMDTVRVWKYVRYELGFRTRARVEPMVHDLETFVHDHEFHDVGTLTREHVRIVK